MSYQILKADVLFYHRFLKSNGYYAGTLDGYWGPVTGKADADFLKDSNDISAKYGTFDAHSEANIITLIPKAQIEARKFLKIGLDKKYDVRILSGTRTYAEQNLLYAHGRNGIPGPIITKAKGGQSNHNFGIAWDIGLFNVYGTYITSDKEYRFFAEAVLPKMGSLEWGGDWKSFKDYPHYQLKAVSESVTVVRNLFEKGKVYV